MSFVNTRNHWAWVGTDISWNVAVASRKPDPIAPTVVLEDLPLQAGYAYTFVDRDDGLVLMAGPRA